MDPLAILAMSWSPYRYGFDNPLRFTDPNGMAEYGHTPHDNNHGTSLGISAGRGTPPDWVVGGSAGNQPVWDDNVHSTADAQKQYGDGAKDVTENGATYNYTHGGRGVALSPNGSWDYTYSEMTQELPTGNGFEALQSSIRSMSPLLTSVRVGSEIAANLMIGGLGAVEAGANIGIQMAAGRGQFMEGLAEDFATKGLAANRLAGNAFRDELAQLLQNEGRDVAKEVYKWTPFGKRFIDIEVSQGGKVLGGIETKVGGSVYHRLQRVKDAYLEIVHGYKVDVVRKPVNW